MILNSQDSCKTDTFILFIQFLKTKLKCAIQYSAQKVLIFVLMWSPWLRLFRFQWKYRNMNALVAQFAACFCIPMSNFMLPESQKHKWEIDPYCTKCHESQRKTPLLVRIVKIWINDCAMGIRMETVYVYFHAKLSIIFITITCNLLVSYTVY